MDWLERQRLSYSVGFTLPAHTPALLAKIPDQVWTPAYDAHDQVRDGAWVAELTGLLDLKGWPAGMRVIARKERPHPGAQLRITDIDGLRVSAFATNTVRGQLPELEVRHRRRAEAESWPSSSVGDENPLYPVWQLGHAGRGHGWPDSMVLARLESAGSAGIRGA